MLQRPRRNRRSKAIRSLVRETELTANHLVLPLFVQEGEDRETPIASMPGVSRLGLRRLLEKAKEACSLGVSAVALFPALDETKKDARGVESLNPDGLLQRTVRALKAEVPELAVITDVALDPYSCDGHDGLVVEGRIDNDQTLPLLSAMAVAQAQAGADIVAPSDMMDGRVRAIREALDAAGHTEVGICSYAVKYASAFYGPFREALDSAPRSGDKRTYQMDPPNHREAIREALLDVDEGADWLLVKPGLPYLDIVHALHERVPMPIAVYHVSGEYSMLKAAAANGNLDYSACLLESMMAFRRAGASIIFTYAAIDVARLLCRGA
ncbi:MAG TPA: porphobilinogen synthase [Polyangiaceae bacterium]